ncbi:hypothetical protein [Streptomyces sp. MC1]|uniref:hypothetical protein n=1 Tax=Streptomyces sp. MC1 TaxID=295105 RepID=UPI001E4316AD|nr:hypothetical protein [Streptomyces sp. MC1]
MQGDTRSWAARWSFTTASGVTSGTARAASFQELASLVSKAAEQSLANLTENEGDALDGPWNRFLARMELLAERGARSAGSWHYAADGWADIEITHITDHQTSGE